MKEYPTESIRNVALTGHSSTGKTTLTEAILFANKLVDRMGAIEAGSTQSDYDAEEIKRKTSINATLFPIELEGVKINLLDCPGYRDFLSEVKAPIRVSELALICVDPNAGPEIGTEFAWEFATAYGIPRAFFINKLDKERADFEQCLEKLAEEFQTRVIPVALPIGKEAGLKGVVDLVTMKACLDKGGNKPQWSDIPADMVEAAKEARIRLVEAAAEGNDELTEKFLLEETLSDTEVIQGLRESLVKGGLIPALCGSATTGIGLSVLQNFICTLAPSPAQHPGFTATVAGKAEPEVLRIDSSKPLVGFAFKTINDEYAGRLSLFKIVRGALSSETAILNAVNDKQERIAHVLSLRGKKQSNIHQVFAGDIAAVAKLDSVRTNHTVIDVKGKTVKVEPTSLPPPTVFMSVHPKSKGEEDKVALGIHRQMEADPSLHLERDSALHQTILSGMGETHLDVVVARLRSSAHVEVDLTAPKVQYRETIAAKAEGQGKHKKQTGGHGQFGDCWIRLEPMPRGGGFEFVWAIVGGVIPSNFQKSIEKGIVQAMEIGIQAGYPAVDMRATCYFGSYHDVDSSDMAFQLAARKGFRNVSVNARPIILEPYMNVKVVAPESNMGDIMGNLSGKRGRITGSNVANRKAIVEAQVPQAEMTTYSRELRSMTGGRASFEMTFSHYEPTPPQIQEQLIASSEKMKEEED